METLNHTRRQFMKIAGISAAALSLTACGKIRQAPRPNILFAIADDAGYPHMGAYGCEWVNTPAFDRIAKEGVLFTRAYTPNAKCAPSRACILTGRNSWQLENAANHMPHFPAKFKTYVETLAENGYHVGYNQKGWSPGDPGTVNGKPRELCGPHYNKRRLAPPTTEISNSDYAANFEDFLSDRPEGTPFCFWYGALEPHRGYEYESGVKKGGKSLKDIDRVPEYWPDNERVRNDMLDYAYEIEWFDAHLQKMLAKLEEIGELENTVVVATGDHGMPFPRVKGQAYEASNHVPLAIMWKNGLKNPGRVVDDFVAFIDLAPTWLELGGVDLKTGGMQPIQGRSLTDILYSSKSGIVNPERDHVLIAKERHDIGRPHEWGYPIRGIVKGDYRYIHNYQEDRWPAGNPETGYLNCDASPTKTVCIEARRRNDHPEYWKMSFGKRPAEELYNIRKDPDCVKNLADEPAYAEIKSVLKAQMEAELTAQNDPRMFGNGHVFDDYRVSPERFNGFYDRFVRGEESVPNWIDKTDVDPLQ